MKYLGIEINVKNKPVLDEGFIPIGLFNKAFLKTATEPLAIAIYRNEKNVSVFDTKIHGTKEMEQADFYYVDRLVKFLLWAKGGYKIVIFGSENVFEYIKSTYSKTGARSFDYDFVSKAYENQIEVLNMPYDKKVEECESPIEPNNKLNGNRIGFDAGGSDMKVSAVVNGEAIFSKEIVWLPKVNEDPDYHYNNILAALKEAASHMPTVDAIGISSAGIYIDNRAMIASLFIKVPEKAFNEKVKDIYIRACKEIGENIPVVVANDGDVAAIAGAMELKDNSVLGIAMGTSEAAGFVNENGSIMGWLNELAFTPVDANPEAMVDEWSGDIGCGVKYFSQDGVIKLAPRASINLEESLTPAEKLKVVQGKVNSGDKEAAKVYESIGCYLAHALELYSQFYGIKHVLLLGRVMSGEGGQIIFKTANDVLKDEYPELSQKITLHLPDEHSRRVGQSVAAASLPVIK